MLDHGSRQDEDAVGRYVARDGAFLDVNTRLAALVDASRKSLLGGDPLDVIVPATPDGTDAEPLLRGTETAEADGVTHRVTLLGRDPLDATLRLARIDADGEPAVLGVVVPHTDPSVPHTVSVLERATADLVRATGREEVCTVAVETAVETLGLDVVGIYALDDGRLSPVASSEATATSSLPAIGPTNGTLWEPLRTGESRVVAESDHDLDVPLSLLVVPLGDHGLLVAAADGDRRLEESVEVVRLLAANVGAALDRVEREERLARLHEATRRLMSAETVAEVADVAVGIARNVLSHDICSIHFYDPDRDVLVPAAASERTREFLGDEGDLPSFERGESLAFEAFESGETCVYDRVNEQQGVMDPTTQIRSELMVPLGDRGVFIAGSVLPGQYAETDVSLAKVLCANVEAALERAEREETLRTREAELRERNARLDEFASVVSHDLRNPLNVAEGRLELAREACACGDPVDRHLDTVAESHRRMAELVDDLLTLARQGRGLGDTEPVDLTTLARTCWEGIGGGDLVIVDDVTVDADRSRLRELVENLLRNAVEHAGPEPTIRIGVLSDGRTDDGGTGDAADDAESAGFYVEDDGPGIPPGERETVFEYGYSTDDEGTGFGLAIVGAVAEAHGWDVRLTDGSDGGARFEFLL
jgi:nitrogen-specific signal transduction histidine kinase